MASHQKEFPVLDISLRQQYLPYVYALENENSSASEIRQLSRSLALCAVAGYSKLDPATAATSLLSSSYQLGFEAIHWHAVSRRLFFIQPRHQLTVSINSDELIQQAITSMRALLTQNLSHFDSSLHHRLIQYISDAKPNSSFWILAIIDPYETMQPNNFHALDDIQNDFPHVTWYVEDIATLSYWLGQPLTSIDKPSPATQLAESAPITENKPSRVTVTLGKAPPIRRFSKFTDVQREAWEVELLLNETNTPSHHFPLGAEEFPPIEFQMVNGHNVKIDIDLFWERLTQAERNNGEKPRQYYAIRVYSTEDAPTMNLKLYWEYRPGFEFSFTIITKIWDWLSNTVETRKYRDYDSMDEFLEDFDAIINEFSVAPADAVEHYNHLPEMTNCEDFDKVDDYLLNDQIIRRHKKLIP